MEKYKYLIKIGTLLIIFACLNGCAGVPAQANLTTSINSFGMGENRLILSVPVNGNLANLKIFDNLPDLSLLSGVSIKDYRSNSEQGVDIQQPFWTLWQLNGNPEYAHFVNFMLPGTPVLIKARWEPGLFTRRLTFTVNTNFSSGNFVQDELTMASLSMMPITFVVDLPGKVIQQNGELVDDHTVRWQVSPMGTQSFEAVSEVINLPMLLSLLFSLSAVVCAVLPHIGGADSPRKNTGPITRLAPKSSPPRRLPPVRR